MICIRVNTPRPSRGISERGYIIKLKQLLVLTCILLSIVSTASAESADIPVLQIGHITDTHYGQSSAETEVRIPLFGSKMNSINTDFVICTGDMVSDRDFRPAQINGTDYSLRSLRHLLLPRPVLINETEYNMRLFEYLTLMSEFDGPIYHVFGNHDVICQNKSISIQTLNNKNLDSYMPSNYYYFDSPESGYRFIFLDGQYNANGTDKKIGDVSYSDAFFPSEELDWLEKTLQDAKNKKLNVIIFHHQPIKYHPLAGKGIDFDRTIEVKGARSVSGIIEDSGIVQCVIQGHLHYTDTVIDEESGVYYLTSEACADNFAYSVIEIFTDHSIKISGEINQEISAKK